ncbi:YqaA family protein [Terasakiella sp. A23]|uniref:YqaA family protein n=1 Tax=Terasakiella sp. FCG-A23 TaxID=3080561 RepID=UPI0029556390|nr:YqaA family protein [Terasakiella sp. A23]MDV7340060.1 YqaA family protein [Terasakiella sp. A23]
MLQRCYDWTMNLAAHQYAILILCVVSFAESSFFPIPPDIVMIPMILAARDQAWKIATLCTISSVLGGIAGYGIGYGLFETVAQPVLEFYHAAAKFEAVKELYNEHGVLIVFSAGFSPIPYKLFTIASGVTQMDLTSFALTSLVGRGARFFLIAALLWKFGAPIKIFIEQHLGKLSLAFVVLLVGGFALLKLWH